MSCDIVHQLRITDIATDEVVDTDNTVSGLTAATDGTDAWNEEDIVRWAFGEPRRPRPRGHPAATGHRCGQQSQYTAAQLEAIGRDVRLRTDVARAYRAMSAPPPAASLAQRPATVPIMPASAPTPTPQITAPPAAPPPIHPVASTPQNHGRPWTADDTTTLASLWEHVRSLALIGILMQRSPSSIRTHSWQAGLAPRDMADPRQRRPWTAAADSELDAAMKTMRRPDGRVPIIAVARHVGRSVDAVIARLTARHGEDAEVLRRLHVDVEDVGDAAGDEPARKSEAKVAVSAAAGQGMQRNCLRCRKPFWSSGAGNRICGTCARVNEQYACW